MNLQAALNALAHPDPRHRDLAAAHIGDILRGAVLDQANTERAVTHLVAIAITDVDPTVRESALNSISEAFNSRTLPLTLFQPLQHSLGFMEPALLEHALYVLAATHNPAARPAIEAFINHPDDNVRRSAADALSELPGRQATT
jgi:HEAT repeat protein